jgi:hypothetical protein
VNNKLWKSRILKEAEDIKTLLEKYSIPCVHMDDKRWYWVRVMVLNGTINNISVISWLSVLLMLKSWLTIVSFLCGMMALHPSYI